jgi:hypothetical protein
MSLLVYPAAFMANTFAMMLVMIGLSLFGKPALAADFGLIHGATVALFYAFSGNARSLILAESGEVDAASILRLRLMLLMPLGILAFMLCIGVVDSGWLLVLLLVVRRAAEWLAEIFLSEQELHHRGRAALLFLLIQGCLSLALLPALLDGGGLALPMTLLWSLSPLIGCVSLGLLCRALRHPMPLLSCIRQLLPHFGSTLVIGVSVYVFRLFILLVAGKQVAGDLFSAFALGGILGAMFSQALGPTMVRHEQRSAGLGGLVRLFNLMLVALLLAGLGLVTLVWSLPQVLDWTRKGQLFWLAVGCSLAGGVVMVLAQRIRLRIIQDNVGGDVFGSDILANILLVASIPLLFFWVGPESLTLLYLLGAFLSYIFYASEKGGLPKLLGVRLGGHAIPLLLAVMVMMPVFFQLKGGVFDSKDIVFSSEGVLSQLPLPVSIFACYLGLVFFGGYSEVRRSLSAFFFLYLGMLLSTLLAGPVSSERLILLIQYLLPVAALIMGEQFGQQSRAIPVLSNAATWVLWLVVPVQLFSSWQLGYGYLSPSLYLFSVYQHLQYVPVLFVGLYWFLVFARDDKSAPWDLWGLGFLMAIYVVKSQAMAAMLFMILAASGYAVRYLGSRAVNVFVLVAFLVLGAWLGYVDMAGRPSFVQKFSSGAGLPVNILERTDYWSYFSGKVFDDSMGLLLGHAQAIDRNLYPSSHNYYLDVLYAFGCVGLLPLFGLILYTLFKVASGFLGLWRQPALLGLVGVLLFWVLVDNSLKVGLRQPYSGILTFFFWGVLLAQFARPAACHATFNKKNV